MGDPLEIIFLGTGSAVPSEDSWHSAIVMRYRGRPLIFDCGEGCQIRMQQAKVSPMKVKEIFLTHLHPDHTLGLAGLISSMRMNERKDELKIFGPVGTGNFVSLLSRLFFKDHDFKITVHEIERTMHPKTVFKSEHFSVMAVSADHVSHDIAYAFVEHAKKKADKKKMEALGLPSGIHIKQLKEGKTIIYNGKEIKPEDVIVQVPGKKVVYTGDTRPCSRVVELAKDADLLIHEACYPVGMEDKALEYYHSTVPQAADVASKAGAKRLAIVHRSRRMDKMSDDELIAQAKAFSGEIIIAKDLMRYLLKD